jgi:hypothetical protein
MTAEFRKREPLMDQQYFNSEVIYDNETIGRFEAKLAESTAPPQNRTRLAYTIFRKRFELLIMRYSRGELVPEIKLAFPSVIESLERYQHIEGHQEIAIDQSLDDYVTALWLVCWALIFKVDTGLFTRLLSCIGNTGKDSLLERLIATRIPNRPKGNRLAWPRQYQVLSEAIAAPAEMKPRLLERFLKGWYSSMRDLYWHENHKGPDGGGFFGYWCIEAAGVVSAFGFEDEPFRDMPYYPKDLVLRQAG